MFTFCDVKVSIASPLPIVAGFAPSTLYSPLPFITSLICSLGLRNVFILMTLEASIVTPWIVRNIVVRITVQINCFAFLMTCVNDLFISSVFRINN